MRLKRSGTVAETLSAGGYFAAMVVKWHLGEPAETQPINKGFEWCAYFRGGRDSHAPLMDGTRFSATSAMR